MIHVQFVPCLMTVSASVEMYVEWLESALNSLKAYLTRTSRSRTAFFVVVFQKLN